jgi:hypothetical protein
MGVMLKQLPAAGESLARMARVNPEAIAARLIDAGEPLQLARRNFREL